MVSTFFFAAPVRCHESQVHEPALHFCLPGFNFFHCPFIKTYGGEPRNTGQAFLASRIYSVYTPLVNLNRNAAQGSNRIYNGETVMAVGNIHNGFHI